MLAARQIEIFNWTGRHYCDNIQLNSIHEKAVDYLKRNKKIILLAHCILNVNAKVHGLAVEPAGCRTIVSSLMDHGFGIIQLPCVEQSCFGINRWGQVKRQLDFPGFHAKSRALLQPVIEQVLDFQRNGYQIAAVVGLDGSPSCGVNFTCSGDWGGEIGEGYDLPAKIASLSTLPEAGVMMDVLREMLAEVDLIIDFLGIDESDPAAACHTLLEKLV